MEGRKGGSWLPFSSGPRLCIGYTFALLEMKVMPLTLQCLFPDTEERRNTTAATAQVVYMDKLEVLPSLPRVEWPLWALFVSLFTCLHVSWVEFVHLAA